MEPPTSFASNSSEDRLLHTSPLETLVRRTSSRRRVAKHNEYANHAPKGSVPPPSRPPPLSVPPPPPFASQSTPESPLLHSNFRNSTTTLHNMGLNSRSFLPAVDSDDCEVDDGYYGESSLADAQLHVPFGYNTSSSSSTTFVGHQPNLWPLATGLTQPANLEEDIDFMDPPSPVPTVVVSSPQDDNNVPTRGPLRQPIVSTSPRLNFSRPGRPPILSSEEQKRQVLERNSQRPHSPRVTYTSVSLFPVTPVTGSYDDQFLHAGPYTPGEQSPISSPASSSSASPGRIVLPSHPPSLRAGSPSSLYSTTYSFYQLDGRTPSPTSTGSRSPPNPYPASNSPTSTEPQKAFEYLQMGIQFHESNQLKESAMYFEKSAKEQGGCGVGMLMWGLTLRHGWGCEKNEKSGFKWLTKAAESAVEDLEQAKKGFETKAVKEELVLAIYEVGQCFFQGWGVAKDQKMAVNYYRVAANLGDVDAQQDLAFCLANGKGCKKDKKEAARWYRAAVAQGASDVGMAWIYKDKYKG